MTLVLDWWQLGWVVAGFFLVMFFALAFATRGQSKQALKLGHDQGWHDRQHWETDEEISGKLRRQ